MWVSLPCQFLEGLLLHPSRRQQHTHTHIPLVVLVFPCLVSWKLDIFKDIMYLDVPEMQQERAVVWRNLQCLIAAMVQTRSPGAVALFGGPLLVPGGG